MASAGDEAPLVGRAATLNDIATGLLGVGPGRGVACRGRGRAPWARWGARGQRSVGGRATARPERGRARAAAAARGGGGAGGEGADRIGGRGGGTLYEENSIAQSSCLRF